MEQAVANDFSKTGISPKEKADFGITMKDWAIISIVSLALGLLLAAFTLSAQQEPAKADGYRYVDAATLPVFGKVADNTAMRYSRLPASLKGVTRGPVWSLGLNSAGDTIRCVLRQHPNEGEETLLELPIPHK